MQYGYISQYNDEIQNGSIIVGSYIRKWYESIITGLNSRLYTYDEDKANRAINFIEKFCRHHEGELGGQLIQLELWQKAFLSIVFGIIDEQGNRQFREVVLVMGRKNGKTLLASAIAAYCLFADNEYGARIYMSAPKLAQASLCFDALTQMIKKDACLDKRAKKRRSDIYIDSSNSSVAPLAFSAKKSDGLNISLGICDEIASWSGDGGLKFYEVLKSSFGARKQPLLLSISTAGYENEGVFDELVKRCTNVIKGNSNETRLAPFLYMIDNANKWEDINELKKSNPNLDVSITTDYLREEMAIAQSSLSKRGEFLTKYCNIKQNSSTAWLDAVKVHECCVCDLKLQDFTGCYAVGGIDLSQTTDLTACNLLVEKDSRLYNFTQFFMPRELIADNSARDGINYQSYVNQGYLTPSGDNFVDYNDCYDWFVDLIEKYKIYVLKIGYDRYTAQYLVQDLNKYGFHTDDVYQGENLTPCINEVEGLINDKRISFIKNPLMEMHLLDSAVKVNNETRRRKLVKIEPRRHIDGTASLLDAIAVRQKYWEEIGTQLKNERK